MFLFRDLEFFLGANVRDVASQRLSFSSPRFSSPYSRISEYSPISVSVFGRLVMVCPTFFVGVFFQ